LDNWVTLASLNATVLNLPGGCRLDTVGVIDWQVLRDKREQFDTGIDA